MYFSPFKRTLRISGFSLGLSLLFFFSPLVGSAQSGEDDLVVLPLTLSDLTPQDRNFVSNLAVSMAVSSVQSTEGTGDYDATISANIASILSLLQSYKYRFASASAPGFSTYPIFSGTVELSKWLSYNLNEETVGAVSTRPHSFLYEIQRALYGQSGVPAASQALLPFLYSAYGFTNALYSSSHGDSVGDMLRPVYSFYDEAESAQLNPWHIAAFFDSIPSIPGTWSELWDVLYMGNSNLIASGFSDAPEPYEGTGLYVMEGSINNVWRDNASNASASESALQVVDPEVASSVRGLQDYLSDIRNAIEGLSGGSSSSFNITNVVSYSSPGSDEISEGQFSLSPIASSLRESYSSLITNVIPPSIGAVDTNSIFRLTNIAMSAMPNMEPVKNYIQDSFDPFQYSNVGTGTEITLFNSFNHSGITIPGMSLDLGDSRLNVLRVRCNWLARLSYALLFLVLTILRIRSFLDYVVSGFSSIYGGELESSSSSEGFSA